MTIENAIIKTANYLTRGEVGRRVYVAQMKDILREEDFTIPAIDQALIQMGRENKIVLMRLDDPTEITERDARFATKSGGQDNHIFYVR